MTRTIEGILIGLLLAYVGPANIASIVRDVVSFIYSL